MVGREPGNRGGGVRYLPSTVAGGAFRGASSGLSPGERSQSEEKKTPGSPAQDSQLQPQQEQLTIKTAILISTRAQLVGKQRTQGLLGIVVCWSLVPSPPPPLSCPLTAQRSTPPGPAPVWIPSSEGRSRSGCGGSPKMVTSCLTRVGLGGLRGGRSLRSAVER